MFISMNYFSYSIRSPNNPLRPHDIVMFFMHSILKLAESCVSYVELLCWNLDDSEVPIEYILGRTYIQLAKNIYIQIIVSYIPYVSVKNNIEIYRSMVLFRYSIA